MKPQDQIAADGRQPAEGAPRPVAVTVKLDDQRYRKLKMHAMATRLSSQEIMVRALDHYLGS